MKLSIEELKKYSLAANREVASMADELIALREMKGDQVPVAYLTRHVGCRAPDDCEEYLEVSGKDGVSGNGEPAIPVFTAPQKPVVLPDGFCDNDGGWVIDYAETVAAIEAAGGVVRSEERERTS